MQGFPAVLRLLIKPLARFCVRHSISLQAITEALKIELLRAAQEEIKRSGADRSASKLSAMTGVHRKDVARLESVDSDLDQPKSVCGRVLAQWQQSEKFTTKSGKPRTLSVAGAKSEFVDLVRSVSADLNPYTVLFELERSGAVKKTAHGLALAARVFIPKGDIVQGFAILSDDLNDLTLTVEQNLLKPQADDPHLHLRTEYHGIPYSQLAAIQEWLLREGSALHQRARNFLSACSADASSDQQDKTVRVVLGSFGRSEVEIGQIERANNEK